MNITSMEKYLKDLLSSLETREDKVYRFTDNLGLSVFTKENRSKEDFTFFETPQEAILHWYKEHIHKLNDTIDLSTKKINHEKTKMKKSRTEKLILCSVLDDLMKEYPEHMI